MRAAAPASLMPRTFSISRRVTAPGLSRRGRAGFLMSTIVDSRPIRDGPPSRIERIRPPSPWRTCSAVVGLTYPNGLALGAARGVPAARMSRRKRGWDGMRTATLSRPADTMPGTAGFLGSTRVSGPGQNRRASLRAAGFAVATRPRSRHEAICTMSGSVIGRPLAVKMRRQAPALNASAASP